MSPGPSAIRFAALAILLTTTGLACGTTAARPDAGDAGPDAPPAPALRINELMPNDEGGTAIDEQGRVGDWIELVNTGASPVNLAGFTLSDRDHPPNPLPPHTLQPGGRALLWADGNPDRGALHLDFKLSAGGDRVVLRDLAGTTIDAVDLPALGANEALARIPDGSGAFSTCRYATPRRSNGTRCGPPPPPELPTTVQFQPFVWPREPPPPMPLAVVEVALFPARYVAVMNHSTTPVALANFSLHLAPYAAGDPLPAPDAGIELPWPSPTLVPGELTFVPVDPAADADALLATPEREGMVILRDRTSDAVVDRVDFMRWPDGAVLALDGLPNRFVFCTDTAPTPAMACERLPARDVGDRIHAINTPTDFAALAAGGTELESQSVKFVVDMQAGGDVVHFLATKRWPLHYTFVRERVYHQPQLDRCDPLENDAFVQGWIDFSLREYFRTDRRFLLGTAVRWGGGPINTIEFAVGDVITGEQMKRAFFAAVGRLPDPTRWAVRPQAPDQIQRIRSVEGQLPIVDPNAPFRGRSFQPLVAGTGYGTLRFVPGSALQTTPLGPQVIVVTDEVPNDIPLTGGLVTEAFQTPLAHVAVLSKNRGTPDVAVTGARTDARIAPFLNTLVRLDVTGAGFSVRAATVEEATAFWEMRRPQGPLQVPRLDTSVRGPVGLAGRGFEDLPAVGAKAAGLAELYRMAPSVTCTTGLPLPPAAAAFAIPVVHSLEHFETSGAAAVFARWRGDPAFAADPAVRAAGLAEIRAAVLAHPIDPTLVAAVANEIRVRFGAAAAPAAAARLRSSSNTEDLPGFTGAGLYTSVSAELDGGAEVQLEAGIKTVWSSLWLPRGYDERELARVDHAAAAMGVLVHPAFPDEAANGVAISRNVLDPIYGDAYYWNAQAGEASVTNPAPGVTSEQGVYELGFPTRIQYTGQSSLVSGAVATPSELDGLMCALGAIHRHFKSRLDPGDLDHWFAVDIEWKLLGPERRLLIKQARPYSFGRADRPTDCREF